MVPATQTYCARLCMANSDESASNCVWAGRRAEQMMMMMMALSFAESKRSATITLFDPRSRLTCELKLNAGRAPRTEMRTILAGIRSL